MDLIFWILILVFLVACSAFFSATELALFSLTRVRVRRMVKQGVLGALDVEKVKKNPGRLITTVLIGNTVVNISAAALATGVAVSYFGEVGIGIATGLMTLILLTFGEIVPKTIAIHNPEQTARSTTPFLRIFEAVLSPVITVFEAVPSLFIKKPEMDKPLITEKEIRSILEIGVEEKAIEDSENQVINHLLDFRDTPIRNSMLPLKEAAMLDSGIAVDAAKLLAVEKGFSRYPVFSKESGRIIGVIHTKHLDRLIKEGKDNALLKDVVGSSGPILISEKESLDTLFRKMQREHIHMAVVVDEKGNQTGIISFEDLIEEIFGDIKDEEEHKRGKA